ncbi:MAG: PilZ domain-containing protein [Candidatus Acidiferrales bacterium]
MQPEHPRSRRYSFVAIVDVVDVKSESEIQGRTTDLSQSGCFIETKKTWPPETKVRVRIFSRGANFTAFGRVAHVRPNAGMGIMFSELAPNDQLTLEKWLSQARNQ